MHASVSPFDALEFSAVATFVVTPEHTVIFWNKACEELTGMDRDQLLGTDAHWRPFYQHKRPCLADLVISGRINEAADLYPAYRRSPLSPDGIQAEGWFDKLGGKKRYIRFDAAPIYNHEGLLLGAIETLQDITGDKMQQEHSQNLLTTARAALANTEGLPAYMPICCSCQHIRDSAGTWVAPADYFHHRFGMEFSHTICPPCSHKLYPEIFPADADNGNR